jgi:hypothetical protein
MPDAFSQREADRLVLTAGDYVASQLGGAATWSTDAHTDFDAVETATAFYYEQRGQYLNLTPTDLGHSSVDQVLTPDAVMQVAARSDVLILAHDDAGAPPSLFPADTAVAALGGPLRAYADSHLMSLGEFDVYGRDLTLFVRPAVGVRGLSGPWITSAGVDLDVPPFPASGPACVTLGGATHLAYLPATPQVTATLVGPQTDTQLHARFQGDSANDSYQVQVAVPPLGNAMPGNRRVHLAFSTFFVPSEIGASPDTRQLVILGPTMTRIAAGACTNAPQQP